MSRFPHDLFSARTEGYKGCLIVLAAPALEGGTFVCRGRVVLGGRMSLPMPPALGPDAEEAIASALETARAAIDRLESFSA
jgi:hypothetical protein